MGMQILGGPTVLFFLFLFGWGGGGGGFWVPFVITNPTKGVRIVSYGFWATKDPAPILRLPDDERDPR